MRGKPTDEVAFGLAEDDGPPSGAPRSRRWPVVAVAVLVTAVIAAVAIRVEYAVLARPDSPPAPQRILPAVAHVDAGGTYRFADRVKGRPVTYDPCRSIRIVVDERLAPRNAARLTDDAVARVVAATGLDLHVVGTTRAGPRTLRSLRFAGPDVRPAPVRLAWTTPRHEPALRGDVTGVARSAMAGDHGRRHYVTGTVSLDAPALRNLLALPGGKALVRAVLMHELARLVGLSEVDDPAELMNRDNVGRLDFGPGDREGLALLGQGTCF